MNFSSLAFFAAILLVCAAMDCAAQKPFQTPVETADKAYVPLRKCWEYPLESPGRSSVASENGSVFIAEDSGRVRSLNLRTSAVNWVTELGGNVVAIVSMPTVGVAVVTSKTSNSDPSGAVL